MVRPLGLKLTTDTSPNDSSFTNYSTQQVIRQVGNQNVVGAVAIAVKPYAVEPIAGQNLFSRRLVRCYDNHESGIKSSTSRNDVVLGLLCTLFRLNWANIDHEDLNSGSIKVNLSRLGDINPGTIMDRIGEVLQS